MQHVLDVVYGYTQLAIKLNRNSKLSGEAFNFGPDKNFKVIDVFNKMKFYWPKINWKIKKENKFKENNLLNLNSKKSKKYLKWSTVLDFNKSIKFTVDWYKYYLKNKKIYINILYLKYLNIKKFSSNLNNLLKCQRLSHWSV